jgi:hypothetical protein
MSKSNWEYPEIDHALIEKSMKQARIERSRAVWSLLQSLFSRPESHKDNADFSLRQPKLRLG